MLLVIGDVAGHGLDAIDVLLRRASNADGDIGRYADELVDEPSSDTEDDACLLAVRVH
jgi:hypothetical protein